nr:159_t:CDS:2 [Entrophospora candida]
MRHSCEDVLGMFEPVVDKVLKEECSAMYLAGGFSESLYLISRINKTFLYRGVFQMQTGVIFGLNKNIELCCLVKRGIEYLPTKEFTGTYFPVYPNQKGINFEVIVPRIFASARSKTTGEFCKAASKYDAYAA